MGGGDWYGTVLLRYAPISWPAVAFFLLECIVILGGKWSNRLPMRTSIYICWKIIRLWSHKLLTDNVFKMVIIFIHTFFPVYYQRSTKIWINIDDQKIHSNFLLLILIFFCLVSQYFHFTKDIILLWNTGYYFPIFSVKTNSDESLSKIFQRCWEYIIMVFDY